VKKPTYISGQDLANSCQHPRSTVIKAPKFIVPGVTITQHSIDAAIAHLHGYNAPSGNAADAVELILLARAFGISTLEVIACGHIEKALERSFKVEGLADAVREFYGAYREDPFCDVGNDVVGVVIGVVARCCRKRWGILRAGPGFRLLCKDFPELMEDILDVVAEEDERGGKVVKAEELPQDSTQEFAE
jgi:hypothetical protein